MWPFDWWKPKCPVDFRQKAWIELRMRWLAEQFGATQFSRCKIILPTKEYFPDSFDHTPEAASRLLDRIAGYMGVPPAEIELKVEPKECTSGAVGPDKSGVIHIADSQLADPSALAATLAHELARHVLIRRELVSDKLNLEWTVDLAAVSFGLGILVANATPSESHSQCGGHSHAAHSSSCSCGKQPHAPARVTAYAMALHAWLRGEERSDWAVHLRYDAAEAFCAGLHYLTRTEDSLLRPDNLHQWDKNPSLARLLEQLEQGTASERVAVLWQLATRGPAVGAAAATVARCLNDRSPGICAEAARTMAELGPAAMVAIPELVDVMGHHDEEVRAAAAYALGKLHLQPELVVPELSERLGDPCMLETAAWALAQFGELAQPALPHLLAKLKGELGCGDGAIDFLVYAVRTISPDPEAEFQQLIDSCDPDLRQQAAGLLPEDGPIPTPPGGSNLRFWEL
jgi:hypothetical protein